VLRGDSHNLDLLRALAVSLVLVDHTLKFLVTDVWFGRFDINWLGRLGVAMFFVHTSLVLMLSLERSGLSGWAMIKNFYVRRAFRIYPLAVAIVIFTFLIGIPQSVIAPHVIHPAPRTLGVLVSDITLTQNLTNSANLLGQLWSLPIEVDMYLMLPMLFTLAIDYPRMFRFTAWPIAVLIASHNRLAWIAASTAGFIPCFVPGVLAFNLSKRYRSVLPASLWPVVLLAIIVGFMLMPSWRAAWIVCLILGVSVVFFREQPNQLLNRICHAIAKYSYGIYLGHTFCIWAAFVACARLPFIAQLAIFGTLITSVPYLLFRFVEQPGIELGKRLSRVKQTDTSTAAAHA
jgi:peptidoglycan/LPS O-acetylase OafA/YrhL